MKLCVDIRGPWRRSEQIFIIHLEPLAPLFWGLPIAEKIAAAAVSQIFAHVIYIVYTP